MSHNSWLSCLLKPKMINNRSRNKNHWPANEVSQHATKGLSLFLCCSGGMGVDFLVPNVFPQYVLNSTSFYFISFALNSTLATYISKPKRRTLKYIYFWDCPKLDLFYFL
jgi:hypothetical protein